MAYINLLQQNVEAILYGAEVSPDDLMAFVADRGDNPTDILEVEEGAPAVVTLKTKNEVVTAGYFLVWVEDSGYFVRNPVDFAAGFQEVEEG